MPQLKSVALASILAIVSTPAAAAPIVTRVGSTFMVGLNGSTGDVSQGADSFLSATARFTVTAWGNNAVTFAIDVANTSRSSPGFASRITAFGFDVDPDVLSATVSGGFSRTVLGDTMRAHGLPKVLDGASDLCLKNGKSKGCESGQDGIEQGASALSTLTLTFAKLPPSIAFDDFFVRYQGIDTPEARGLSGGGIATCVDEGCLAGDQPVPEPTMVALMGAGLLGAGYARRRSRR